MPTPPPPCPLPPPSPRFASALASTLASALAAALACAALAAPPAAAREPGQDGQDGAALAALVNAYRAAPGSCAGRAAAPAAPLAHEAALSALRIGAATFLEQALQKAGYAADRAEMISVGGARTAREAMAAIRDNDCARILSEDFTALGAAREGDAWQLILAHPLVLPALPEPAQLRRELLERINAARATPRNCGAQAFGAAAPLAWNPTLARAALGHSQDMAAKRYLRHREADGGGPGERATRAGYRWTRVGENIASGQPSVAQAMAEWLGSPGHCANIMNPAYTETGAAYAVDPASQRRTPYWTQMFGRP